MEPKTTIIDGVPKLARGLSHLHPRNTIRISFSPSHCQGLVPMSDVVDDSSPATIRAAIRRVNQTPGLRIRPGTRALWRIFKAPGHSLSLAELEPEFKALALHFGWFCRRVAEELGEENPREFSLTNKSRDHNGILVLTLKPSVVIAMNG